MANCSCPAWTNGWAAGDTVTYLTAAGDTVTGFPMDLTPATHTVRLMLADGTKVLVGGHGSADTFVTATGLAFYNASGRKAWRKGS